MCRPLGLDLLGALDRRRRHQRDPQATVGREGLLRREVVGVGLRHVDGQAAGARGRVDQHQRAVVGAGHAFDRHHDAGRGLVVRPRVRVDARLGDRHGVRRELALQHVRIGEERCALHRRGELAGELAVHEVLAALADEPEHRRVEERVRAADAEHDLVAVGQREQLGETLAEAADEVAHGRLPVRGAHERARRSPPARRAPRRAPWTGRTRIVRPRAGSPQESSRPKSPRRHRAGRA